MPIRKDSLVSGQYYHVFVRSIAGFVVFNNVREYKQMEELISICRYTGFDHRYSRYKRMSIHSQLEIQKDLEHTERYVHIISYCLMPTHIHLLLKQDTDDGISIFMKKVLSSYAKRFNRVHKRNGPLWASRFKNVLVNDDEQLLHLTRYIHLNPTSAGLVSNPEDWQYSSYRGYIFGDGIDSGIIDMDRKEYKCFVEDRKGYQKELSKIKALLIDGYSG